MGQRTIGVAGVALLALVTGPAPAREVPPDRTPSPAAGCRGTNPGIPPNLDALAARAGLSR
jgi:hypothetical protein